MFISDDSETDSGKVNSLNSSQEKFDINHILNVSFALKICLFIKELYFLTSMLC